jgi:Domain of unknown function (DUF4180)
MAGISYDRNGIRIFEFASTGAMLRDASDILGEACGAGANLVVLPVARLDPDFFQLRTGIAGEIMKKFVNYGLRLTILGDVSAFAAASRPLHDLIYEMNHGDSIWFLADAAELKQRLDRTNP